jgi:tRNA (guanine37-N1)-methyltransferase
MSKGAYVMEVHYPVSTKEEKDPRRPLPEWICTTSQGVRTYGIRKYLLVTPLAQQRDMAKKIAAHWTEGGARPTTLTGAKLFHA